MGLKVKTIEYISRYEISRWQVRWNWKIANLLIKCNVPNTCFFFLIEWNVSILNHIQSINSSQIYRFLYMRAIQISMIRSSWVKQRATSKRMRKLWETLVTFEDRGWPRFWANVLDRRWEFENKDHYVSRFSIDVVDRSLPRNVLRLRNDLLVLLEFERRLPFFGSDSELTLRFSPATIE